MPTPTFGPGIGNLDLVQKHAYLTNGWIIQLGGNLSGQGVNFQKLSGLKRSVGAVEVGNPNGINTKSNSGIIKFEDITLSFVRNGAFDEKISRFFTDCFKNGVKLEGTFFKYHHGAETRKIKFYGLFPKDETLPEYDLQAEAREEVSLLFSVDWWAEEYSATQPVVSHNLLDA